jgi:hypothetical protein
MTRGGADNLSSGFMPILDGAVDWIHRSYKVVSKDSKPNEMKCLHAPESTLAWESLSILQVNGCAKIPESRRREWFDQRAFVFLKGV